MREYHYTVCLVPSSTITICPVQLNQHLVMAEKMFQIVSNYGVNINHTHFLEHLPLTPLFPILFVAPPTPPHPPPASPASETSVAGELAAPPASRSSVRIYRPPPRVMHHIACFIQHLRHIIAAAYETGNSCIQSGHLRPESGGHARRHFCQICM